MLKGLPLSFRQAIKLQMFTASFLTINLQVFTLKHEGESKTYVSQKQISQKLASLWVQWHQWWENWQSWAAIWSWPLHFIDIFNLPTTFGKYMWKRKTYLIKDLCVKRTLIWGKIHIWGNSMLWKVLVVWRIPCTDCVKLGIPTSSLEMTFYQSASNLIHV